MNPRPNYITPAGYGALKAEYDAVFLGMGLAGVNALGLPGDNKTNAVDAVDFIADLRQAGDLAALLLVVRRGLVDFDRGVRGVKPISGRFARCGVRLAAARARSPVGRRQRYAAAADDVQQALCCPMYPSSVLRMWVRLICFVTTSVWCV